MNTAPLLSLVIWIPIVGGVALLAIGDARKKLLRNAALATAGLALLLCLLLFAGFDASTAAMQFTERVPWIDAWGVHYHVGVDGISMPLIALTALMTLLVVIAARGRIHFRESQYLAAFLVMEGLIIGVFSALDAVLFYAFWEAMLIPMFLIIGVWGGPRRIYATVKFFLYTFFGSVFMLVALVYMYIQGGSFAVLDLHRLPLTMVEQTWIFLAFLIAFAVKVPMFPVHTWLPDAHVEAPTGGSVILAAILLKLGAYGFVRFSLPVAPDASGALDWLMIALSLVAVVYIALVALAQTDLKKLIAYSSIAHMGFATLGFFVAFSLLDGGARQAAAMGVQGGLVQLVSHGFISGALFMCVGVLYDRVHSREISAYGGVAVTMPKFAAFAVLFAMANAGLPGTSGFVGEFMVILASFQADFWFAFLAGTTLVLGAAYTLWMIKRVMYGEVANDDVARLHDLDRRETVVLGVLAAMVLLVGVWPAPLVEVMQVTVDNLLAHISETKIR